MHYTWQGQVVHHTTTSYTIYLASSAPHNHLLHSKNESNLRFLTDGCEFTCPVVEECSPTAVGVGMARGVVVGLISGIVGTVTVLLAIMRKRASKGMV